MGQFLSTNGDYNIRTKEGGKITLDTGPSGEVRVTGNLVVDGDTLTVSAENLEVSDNIITVNFGETGSGISHPSKLSGLAVDRGLLPDSYLVWNEIGTSWEFKQLEYGVGETEFSNGSKIRLSQILTNPDTNDGNLGLINYGLGVVHVSGTQTYEQQVIDFGDDAIPNKKYVDDAIQSNPTSQISRDDTRVIAFDRDNKLDAELFPIGPFNWSPSSNPDAYPDTQVAIVVQDSIAAQFFESSIRLGDLSIFSELPTDPINPYIADAVVIQAVNSSANIKLETNGTGKVEITYALQLNNESISPTTVTDTSLFYAGNHSVGNTGLYHNTYTGPSTYVEGELINKSRALLFSMIF